MTVSDLIEELDGVDGDTPVYLDGVGELKSVEDVNFCMAGKECWIRAVVMH